MPRQFSSKFLPFSVFSDFLPLPPPTSAPFRAVKKKGRKKIKTGSVDKGSNFKKEEHTKKKNKTKRKRKRNGVFESPIRSRSRKEESGHASARFRSKVRHDTRKKSPKKKNKREISPSSLSFRSGKVSLAFLFAPKRICLFVGVDGEGGGGGVGREPKRKKKNEILQKKRAHKKGKDNPIKNAGQQWNLGL